MAHRVDWRYPYRARKALNGASLIAITSRPSGPGFTGKAAGPDWKEPSSVRIDCSPRSLACRPGGA